MKKITFAVDYDGLNIPHGTKLQGKNLPWFEDNSWYDPISNLPSTFKESFIEPYSLIDKDYRFVKKYNHYIINKGGINKVVSSIKKKWLSEYKRLRVDRGIERFKAFMEDLDHTLPLPVTSLHLETDRFFNGDYGDRIFLAMDEYGDMDAMGELDFAMYIMSLEQMCVYKAYRHHNGF